MTILPPPIAGTRGSPGAPAKGGPPDPSPPSKSGGLSYFSKRNASAGETSMVRDFADAFRSERDGAMAGEPAGGGRKNGHNEGFLLTPRTAARGGARSVMRE